MSATADDRRVTLEEPDKYESRAGKITQISFWWGREGYNRSTVLASRGELQAIVTAAAAQYGIFPPTCDCYPGGFSPDSYEGPKEDCPLHGRESTS